MLTQAELKSFLNYDPITGIFTWACSPSKKVKIGQIAATRKDANSSYLRCRIRGKGYRLHRLAWLYMTGESPDLCIDHINGIPSDNRWINLRLATHQENSWNSKKKISNTSGHKGVKWREKKNVWEATINKNGRCHYIGSFKNIDDAVLAVRNYREKIHGEFFNHG